MTFRDREDTPKQVVGTGVRPARSSDPLPNVSVQHLEPVRGKEVGHRNERRSTDRGMESERPGVSVPTGHSFLTLRRGAREDRLYPHHPVQQEQTSGLAPEVPRRGPEAPRDGAED